VTYTTGGDAGTERNFRESDRFTSESLSLSDAVKALNNSGQPVLPVIDPSTGKVIASVVQPGYLAVAMPGPKVGGMATPLGVYLTDGTYSGGAGILGLALTGAVFAVLCLISYSLVGRSYNPDFHSLLTKFHTSWAMALEAPLVQVTSTIIGLLLIFVGLRCTPLAGTHASEHQVVHCIERSLPLKREFVRQMPRVHPRCGTNYAVGLIMFASLFDLFFCADYSQSQNVFDSASSSLIIAGIATLVFWRRIGSVLQQYFATRPATDRQIDNAIKAAEQLLVRRRQHATGNAPRFYLARRIWSYGLLQVWIGYGLVVGILLLLLGHRWPELKSLLEI